MFCGTYTIQGHIEKQRKKKGIITPREFELMSQIIQ